jgi:hypothetical protein
MLVTAAHKLIQIMIQNDAHDASDYAGSTFLVNDGDGETEFYLPGEPALDPDNPRPGWFMFVADEKMVSGVQQTIDEVDRLREEMYKPTVYSEVYLDGSWLDSRIGGTIDVRLIEAFGKAKVLDHKNGYIVVEVKDSDQLKQYAVLVMHEHPDCEEVEVIISQPNAPHEDGLIRSETYSADELKLYEIRMKEAAEATSKPNAPLRAGDWCMWCPANTRCPAFDAMMLEEATADFTEDEPPVSLPTPKSTAELAHKMEWVPVIENWVANIKADIQHELENGNEVAGWKLVRGRSKRRWLSETSVQEVLGLELGDTELWAAPKLKSPAQMEKLGTGKEQRKLVKAAVKELAFMPDGKLAIAPLTDPREAASSLEEAISEFDDDEEDF